MLSLGSILAVAWSGPVYLAQAQSSGRAGEVTEINQEGYQYHSGSVDFLDQGDTIVRDARLETDLVGEMSLTMDDGSQLVMPPSSEIAIDRFVYDPDHTTGQAVFSLGRGALRMISGRLTSKSYRLDTPVATIGVRGTDFSVELRHDGDLVVTVDDGAVEIRPIHSDALFSVETGEIWICSETECRQSGSDEVQLRRASLGPAPGGSKRANKAAPKDNANREALRVALGTSRDHGGTEPVCPLYQIPEWAYRRIGLNPADWPRIVDGIESYDAMQGDMTTRRYCPDDIDFAGSDTSFSVLGQAGPGDRKILYYVNSYAGQHLFQPGFDTRARERDDARAYKDFIANAFRQRPGFRAGQSQARLEPAGPEQRILWQQVDARAAKQAYLISGVTLFRPTNDNRTALFAIPSIVTPRGVEDARTAEDIARDLFVQLPDTIATNRAKR